MTDWIRARGEPLWCSVRVRAGGIAQTRCAGLVALGAAHDTAERPRVAERCTACQAAYAAHQLDQLAAACGDRSRQNAIEAGLRELERNTRGGI